MNERIEDLLAIYALDGLTEDERQAVEAYLAENPEAKVELDEMAQVVDALAYSVPPLQPSTASDLSLMARIEADARVRFGVGGSAAETAVLPTTPSPKSPSIWEQIKRWFSFPAVGGIGIALATFLFVASAVLLGRMNGITAENRTLVAANSDLQTQVSDLQRTINSLEGENGRLAENNQLLTSSNSTLGSQITELTVTNESMSTQLLDRETQLTDLQTGFDSLFAENEQLRDEFALLVDDTAVAQNIASIITSPSAQAISIPGNPETQPDAQGQIVIDANRNTAIMIVSGMEPLPEGSVYQVLLIQGSEHETAETFIVDTQGESILIVNSTNELGTFDAVGVSIEPEGGSEQRTGEVVLIGSLIN